MKIYGGSSKMKNRFFGGGAKILESRALLYFVFLISISNIILFGLYGNINSVIVYLLSAFVISLFNKNMIVILVFSLIISNIHKYGIDYFIKTGAIEGMEEEEEDKEKEEFDGKPEDEDEEKEKFTSGSTTDPSNNTQEIISKLETLIQQNDDITKKLLTTKK